jgi:peroxiredoxin|tara:strand:+ start:977 stop:1474 length:498 start_codon:yes stop_codon:yes gene_type:complete
MLKVGDTVPSVNLPIRVDGDFQTLNTASQFEGKRVLLFALPGAFTPTCSDYQLPGFDEKFSEFQAKGIEQMYCLSVNDTFVMNAWFNQHEVQNVYPLPDGNGEFTNLIGAAVEKGNVGFGIRSWRYAMVINDNVIESIFAEDGIDHNIVNDPFEISTPDNVLENI